MNSTPDIDSLLEGTLDDLADLPESSPFPSGAYQVLMTLESKTINKKPAVEAKMKLVSVEKMEDESATPPVPGHESTVLYILRNNDGKANEIAQGQLKKLATAIAEGLDLPAPVRVSEVIAAAKSLSCLVVVTAKMDKKDTVRQNIVELALS